VRQEDRVRATVRDPEACAHGMRERMVEPYERVREREPAMVAALAIAVRASMSEPSR
jgi:hypothetical protein